MIVKEKPVPTIQIKGSTRLNGGGPVYFGGFCNMMGVKDYVPFILQSADSLVNIMNLYERKARAADVNALPVVFVGTDAAILTEYATNRGSQTLN